MGNSFQKISHLSLGDRAMAVPADVQEEIKELLDPANTTGVHVKLEKILVFLEKVGLAYKAMISPREIMCHPQNIHVQCTECAFEGQPGAAKWLEERPVATQFFGD